MVLAAGRGLRMRPLTNLRAKPALPVLDRPLLHWTLELLARQGVEEVVINLHHRAGTVTRAVGNGEAFGLRIIYSRERQILGTGGGPRKARGFFGREPFLLVNGDVLFDFDLRPLLKRHRESGAWLTLGLVPNPDPRRYSPVRMNRRGAIVSLGEGSSRGIRRRNWLFTGIQVMDPALLERLPPGPSDAVRDLYRPLLSQPGRLQGVPLRGAWYDLGNPPSYLASQMSMLRSGFRGVRRGCLVHPRARIHPRARLVRCVVGRGSVVGEGARLAGSVLWENVRVGRDCVVEGSILASGARLREGERVEDAIVMPAGRGRRRILPLKEGRK